MPRRSRPATDRWCSSRGRRESGRARCSTLQPRGPRRSRDAHPRPGAGGGPGVRRGPRAAGRPRARAGPTDASVLAGPPPRQCRARARAVDPGPLPTRPACSARLEPRRRSRCMLVVDTRTLTRSVRVVNYIARRLESLPALLLASSRPGEVGAPAQAATVITPRPLSAAAVAARWARRAPRRSCGSRRNSLLRSVTDRAVVGPGIPLQDVAPATFARAVFRRVSDLATPSRWPATSRFAVGPAWGRRGRRVTRAGGRYRRRRSPPRVLTGRAPGVPHPGCGRRSTKRGIVESRSATPSSYALSRRSPPGDRRHLAGEPAGDPATLRLLQPPPRGGGHRRPAAAIRYL